jgi:hypothetical protein
MTKKSRKSVSVLTLSDSALLTMAWFMVLDGDDPDEQCRQAMLKELHRCGVIKEPRLAYDFVNENALDEETLDSFAEMFLRPDEPTFEDSFCLATLGIDRFKQRGKNAWPM